MDTRGMKRLANSLWFGIALAVLAVHGEEVSEPDYQKPLIYVPVLPYEFVIEKLAGEWVDVVAIVREGDDCHSYSPAPRQIARMSKANLLFSGDLGFEANFFIAAGDGKSAPRHVNLLEGLDLLEGSCAECLASGGESGHTHSHEDLKDPHVWLSPSMLREQIANIAPVLKDFLPDQGDAAVDRNLAEFTAELEELEIEIRHAMAPLKGQKFYVYHGAFAYFADDFGLEQVAIEMGNRQATPRVIADLAEKAREDDVKLVFVQPQFDQTSSRALADAIGGEIVMIDPLRKDIFQSLRTIVEAVGRMNIESSSPEGSGE